MKYFYRKIEVDKNSCEFYDYSPSYHLLYTSQGNKVYAFTTADGRAGKPLDDYELEEYNNTRKNQNHLPNIEEKKEDEDIEMEKMTTLDIYKQSKEAWEKMKENGFFEGYDTYHQWKSGKRALKRLWN